MEQPIYTVVERQDFCPRRYGVIWVVVDDQGREVGQMGRLDYAVALALHRLAFKFQEWQGASFLFSLDGETWRATVGRYGPDYTANVPAEPSLPELPVLTVTETDAGTWQTFQSDHTGDGALWAWPTLEHAVRSLRSFLLREYAPRS